MEVVLTLLANPTIIGVLVACLFTLISYVVFKTKTKKDDEIWHKVQGMIFNAFNVAEKFIPDSSSNSKLTKVDKALKIFIKEYEKREGKAPDEDLIGYAKDEWAILATEIKKN